MKSFFLIIFLLFTQILNAQVNAVIRLNETKINSDFIDKTVGSLMSKAKVTGLAISILNNKKVVYSKGYGYSNIDKKSPIDTSTIFCAASLSKAVFAYICMMLVEQGILNLDKPLYLYLDKPLPEFEYYADLKNDDRWKFITARHCLSHTSGFPNWWFLNPKTGAFDSTGKLGIYFIPGTRYAYSGEGIKLLQMVIEKLTSKNLEEIAEEKIFNPLGLKSTSYIWQSRFENDFALGHTETEVPMGKKKRKKPGAAGSLETSIADFSRIIEYIVNGNGLSEKLWNEMLSPQIQIYSEFQFPTITDSIYPFNRDIQLGYGLGLGLFKTKYGSAFFKEGHDNDGWLHYNVNFIDKGTSMIIMSNSLNGEKIFKELLAQLIGDTYSPWKWEQYWPYNYTLK